MLQPTNYETDNSQSCLATTSPGDSAGREGVAVKSNMFEFGDFFKSLVGLGDVANLNHSS